MEACNVEGGSGGVLVAPDALRAMSGKERFAYRLGLAVAEAVATGHAWATDYAPRLAADGPDALSKEEKVALGWSTSVRVLDGRKAARFTRTVFARNSDGELAEKTGVPVEQVAEARRHHATREEGRNERIAAQEEAQEAAAVAARTKKLKKLGVEAPEGATGEELKELVESARRAQWEGKKAAKAAKAAAEAAAPDPNAQLLRAVEEAQRRQDELRGRMDPTLLYSTDSDDDR